MNEKLAAALADGFVGVDVKEAVGAVESTVHVELAGVASTLPAASIARTWNVWLPDARPLSASGLEHAANGEPSRLHSNVPASSEPRPKLGLPLLGFVGVDVRLVFGAVLSTVTGTTGV